MEKQGKEGGSCKMTARAYIDAPVPLETLSDESKRRRLLLERKNVEKITFNNEFVDFYSKNKKETFGIGDSCIEIIQGEPEDNLTNGLSLPY